MKPADIEGALAAQFANTSAPPLPEDFDGLLPYALFTRVGGSISERVVNSHSLSIDVYDATWASAQASAAALLEAVTALEGRTIVWIEGATQQSTPIYTVDCAIPYNNPDPLHPNVPRVTFTATVTARAI